jgi:hypothetical protein
MKAVFSKGEIMQLRKPDRILCLYLPHFRTQCEAQRQTPAAPGKPPAQRVLRQALSLSARQSLEALGLGVHGFLPEEGAQAQREAPLKQLAEELQERFGRPTLLRAEYVGPHLLEERVYRFRAV